MNRILVTGACGQIGSEIVTHLRKIYGESNVIGSDIRQEKENTSTGPFEIIDVTDAKRLFTVAKKYKVDTMIHLASILSATAELDPIRAWNLNMGGLVNALEISRSLDLKLFTPSSIGAFGPTTPKNHTPQDTLQRPTTMYGVNKVAGELLCDYYFDRYGLDTRGVRFPGLISYVAPPGGGTTDYAVEIYYEAVKNKTYTSFIAENTYMDMMYMPDALDAIVKLMEADPNRLKHRNAFNVSAISASPEDFATEIRKYIPEFSLSYQVDPARQKIADSWPNSIDSSAAKAEWGFDPLYDLEDMTKHMLKKLGGINLNAVR